MSCGELFLKSASSTFTGYFLIVCVTFIGYGLFSINYILRSSSVEILEEELVSVPALSLILFGFTILLLIILGCCGICREIPCCLEMYAISLGVLAAAQMCVGIFCLLRFHHTQNPQLSEKIYDDITKTYLLYEDDPSELDTTQKWLNCCGVTGPYNYVSDNRSIPLSCCGDDSVEKCTITSPSRFTEGCAFVVFNYVSATNYIIGWCLIIVAATEILGAMMGISLSCAYWRPSRIAWL